MIPVPYTNCDDRQYRGMTEGGSVIWCESGGEKGGLGQSEFCMKRYQLHTKTEDILKRFPALCKRLEGAERTQPTVGAPWVLCLGADLEKGGACVAVQCGASEPMSLGTVTRETVLSLLPVLRARGWHCVLGLEACGFGWRFQRQLRESGAEVLTFAAEALTGRHKTNARSDRPLTYPLARRLTRPTHPQSPAPNGPGGAMPGPGWRRGKSNVDRPAPRHHGP